MSLFDKDSILRYFWICSIAFAVVFAFTRTADAQLLDTSFDPNANNDVNSAIQLADGKILIGGRFTEVGGIPRNRIARLHSDGTVDLAFNPDVTGYVDPIVRPTDSSQIYCMVLQPDGKIIIAGDFTHIAGKKQNRVARLHPDGKLDTAFNADVNIRYYSLIDNTSIHALALQPDGKVIIGGSFASVDDDPLYKSLARLHPNGSLDTSFNARATSIEDVDDIEVLPDGKILVGGNFFNDEKVLRLNGNGTVDNTFAAARVAGSIGSMAVTPEGKIIVNGSFTQMSGELRNSLARLDANGTLDASFISQGFSARGLSMQADGNFFVGGRRKNADGSNDVNFTLFTAQYSTIQSDGNILFYGDFTSIDGIPRGRIARVLNTLPATQTLTASAAGNIQWERGGSAPEVETVAFEVWDNDSLLWTLCGDASFTSGRWEMSGQELPSSSWIRARGRTKGGRGSASSGYVEQISSYGDLVPDLEVEAAGNGILVDNKSVLSFGTQDWLVEGSSKVVTLRNTGTAELTDLDATVAGPQKEDFLITGLTVSSLPVGGSTTFTVTFTPQGAAEREATLLITSNDADETPFEVALTGTGIHQDPTFTPNLFPSEYHISYTAIQQPDGSIFLGGNSNWVDGKPSSGLFRVNDAGVPGMPFDVNTVSGVAVLPTGKVFTTGVFNSGSVFNCWNSADGSRDYSFPGGNSYHSGHGIKVTPADEIIVWGKRFISDNGQSEGFMSKCASTGTVTGSLRAGESLNGLAIQSDGRILVGGQFTHEGYKGLIRLNGDMTVDTSFMGSGSPWINSLETNVIAVQPDGKILIGGSITPVSGIRREGIARLHPDGTLDMDYVPSVNGMIESMLLQADGKVLLGGSFTEVNGRRRHGLARLLPDGSLDLQFDPHVGGQVKGVNLQKDGRILVSGSYTHLGHVPRKHVARLPNNILSSQTLEVSGTSQIQWLRGGSAVEVGQVTFESWNGTAWVSLGNPVRMTGGWVMNGLSLPAKSWVRARGRAHGGFRNGSSFLVEQVVSYGGAFPEITVEVPAENSVENGDLTADFGGVFRNGGNATVNVTVRNTGAAPLTGLAVQVDGMHPSSFSVSALPATLAPGASTTLAVTFSPKHLGVRWAALHILSHDLDESPFQIYLKGTGLNNPPTITGLEPVTIDEDRYLWEKPFTIGDVETPASSLSLSATSSNTELVNYVLFGGSGTSRTLTLQPRPNMFGSTDITISVSDGETVTSVTFTLTVLPVNDVPVISVLADQIIDEDGATPALSFSLSDVETPVDELILSATSNNTTLVPNANIVFGGSGANRTVTVTPAPNRFGTARITVRASDGTGSGSRSFNVTVNPVNDAPTLSPIADQTTDEDTPTLPIPFVVGDVETSAGDLVVTVQSSNIYLVTGTSVVLGGTGTQRTLVITPGANRNGTATITLTVSDGSLTAVRTFLLTVNPVNDAPNITSLPARLTKVNQATGAMAFTIHDPETSNVFLVVTAFSDNPVLVPQSNILLQGGAASRTINITPAQDQSGVAEITVRVSDGALEATSSFTLTVADPVNITQHPAPVQISEGESFQLSVAAEGTGPVYYQWRRNGDPIPTADEPQYFIEEAGLDNAGVYDVIVSNPAGPVPSLSAQVTVHRQPKVDESPLSQIILLGSPLELEVSAKGRPPFRYQWQKNGKDLPGHAAMQLRYSIESSKASDAGSYTVVISNGTPPSATSPKADVGIVSPLPATYGVKEGATLTLAVKASAPPGFTLSYLWKREGTPLSTSDARITGEDDKTLKIKSILPGEDGTYTCDITMTPASGDPIVGSAGDCEVSILARPVLSAIASPAPTLVSETVPLSPLTTVGGMFAKFTAKGLPAGVKLDSATGVFTGKPTTAKTYTVTFTALNAAGKSDPVTITWVVNPLTSLDGVVGTFHGVIERHTPTNAGLGGFVQITTTTKGAVSGSITLAGKKYPVKGALDTSTGDDTVATLIAKRPAALGNLEVGLSIETGSHRLTGSIAEEGSMDAATFTAHRNVWTKTNAPAEPLVAKYTAGIVTTQTGNPLFPQGDGYATLSVSKTGAAKWVGKTADGASFTFSTIMGPDAEVILHALLYKKTGSLQGLTYLDEANGDWFSVEVPPFDWYKQEQSKDRLYKEGFAVHNVDLIGGRYEPVNNLFEFLDIAGGSSPRLVVEDTVPAFELPLTITAPNKVVLLDNPRKMKLAIKAATGIYTGSFTEGTPARKAAISGVLVRNTVGSILRGYGYFTLSTTTDKTSPILSTKARIELAD